MQSKVKGISFPYCTHSSRVCLRIPTPPPSHYQAEGGGECYTISGFALRIKETGHGFILSSYVVEGRKTLTNWLKVNSTLLHSN